jgi:hypothetical protein
VKILVRASAGLALCIASLAGGVAPAGAQQPGQPAQPAEQQREHVVRLGDTLWDLARTYLADPFRWQLIFEANRHQVRDPHWIYPAQRLIIPPMLQRPPLGEEQIIGHPLLPALEPPPQAAIDTPTVIATLDLRRSVISAAEYLSTPWLTAALPSASGARVTRKVDPAAAPDRLPPLLYPNERVQLDMPASSVLEGDSLLIVRPGRRVGNWGSIMEPLALLRIDSVAPGVVLARIAAQFGDARVGDAVLPLAALPALPVGEPEAVENGAEGWLLQFLINEPLHATTDLAFISLGRADGLGIGDELAVYVPAVGTAPATQVATVRVVKAEDRTATVRVVSVNSSALRSGLPVRVIRRIR